MGGGVTPPANKVKWHDAQCLTMLNVLGYAA